MKTFSQLKAGSEKLSVVGLGYVGMPLAAAFSENFSVIGFDVDRRKLEQYKSGKDVTFEVGDERLASCSVEFTDDETRLRESAFIAVAVPTPINGDKTPDLEPVIRASETVSRNLKAGTIVCYESTVYPGVTEDICVPILEKGSGLKCGRDFKVAYSPERINPGDRVHTLRTIKKIVSGMDEETTEQVKLIYDTIVEAGTYPVSSIRTAEAIKLVENSQRDINIAFMNEMAIVFERMGIDTNEVVDGMNTKWNALGFRPGLVGGHCIGVDPYYFVYEAARLGYTSQIVSSGRRINDRMGEFVTETAVRRMIRAGVNPVGANVVILGLTFKENCPDIRNTRVVDIVEKFKEYNIKASVVDPWADKELAKRAYGIDILDMDEVHDADCIVHAVAHSCFREFGFDGLMRLFRDTDNAKKVLIDVKGEWPVCKLKESGITWWRL